MAHADILIAPRELAAHLDDPKWRIVDCRFELARPEQGRADYLAGHIPGAVYADLDRDLAAPITATSGRHPLPAPEAFAATLGRWGIAPGSTVVAYDEAGGAIAARLWWMLRWWFGHRDARVLDGGYAAWRRENLPTTATVPEPEPTAYPPQADDGMIVSTGELPERLERGEVLVDARDADRFAGRREPIDPVAGHVPGAVNFPLGTSLREDGTWHSPETLAKAWEPLLGPPPGRSWITMCGSGVTACHLALSAERAGWRAPRLYAGSFSEWIRDPRRPVAKEDGMADRS